MVLLAQSYPTVFEEAIVTPGYKFAAIKNKNSEKRAPTNGQCFFIDVRLGIILSHNGTVIMNYLK